MPLTLCLGPQDANNMISLRSAIQAGNASTDADVQIDFQPNLGGVITLTLNIGLPALNKDFEITGPGASRVTVQRGYDAGTPNFSVFAVSVDKKCVIQGLEIANGGSP